MRQTILFGLIALLAGCSGTDIPGPGNESPVHTPQPTPSMPAAPATPSQSSVTVSGTVFDYTSEGPRPAANLSLVILAYTSGPIATITDGAGRYSVSGVRAGAISIAPAAESGYYAPCPAGWDAVNVNMTFNVDVVSGELLSTIGAPADMPVNGSIWVSGVVFEKTAEGIRPVAGASVNMSVSNTLTDAQGRYRLCPPLPSTGTDQSIDIQASREGYDPGTATAFLGWDYDGVNIELRRR